MDIPFQQEKHKHEMGSPIDQESSSREGLSSACSETKGVEKGKCLLC